MKKIFLIGLVFISTFGVMKLSSTPVCALPIYQDPCADLIGVICRQKGPGCEGRGRVCVEFLGNS